MDEDETKTCENCKRQIPAVNFTIHAVHCARNIGMCPICKEPMPLAQLPQHHDTMHKLSPCGQCGESVCGTDLEDHVRDSCAHTMKSCRFCSLELRRGELPAHERYCGARTERCADCGEWVMHKYRQLHLDSNHGFIRLDDDPAPTEAAITTTNVPKASNVPKLSSSHKLPRPDLNFPRGNLNRPATTIRHFPPTDFSVPNTSTARNLTDFSNPVTSKPQNAPANTPATSTSRTNEPSIPHYNTSNPQNVASVGTNISRPQTNGPGTNSANNRLSNGPIYSSESNRLANGRSESAGTEAAGVANGASGGRSGAVPRVKRANHEPQLNTCAAAPDKLNKNLWAARKKRQAPEPPREPRAEPRAELCCTLVPEPTRDDDDDVVRMTTVHDPRCHDRTYDLLTYDAVVARRELRDARPMSAEQFTERFGELVLRRHAAAAAAAAPAAPAAPADRFTQIRASLRELRRGLNEVTAPYNSSAVNDPTDNGEERLPCEFCGAPVLPDELVLHQTGCRPDLAQLRAGGAGGARPRPAAPRAAPPRAPRTPSPSPLIPCEFCAAPLPVYLISEHQERCGDDARVLLD